MRRRIQETNGLAGLLVSLYANTDIGKPVRLRSTTLKGFMIRFYHLTHIGLVLSATTLLCGLAIREGKKKGKEWILFNSVYRHLLAVTITTECFIPIVFWVLWIINKESVVTKEYYVGEESISFFFNLCMHGIPSFFLLVEFFLSDFVPSSSHYLEILLFFSFYIGIMHLFYLHTGGWPYQIIATFIGWYRLIFYGYCLFLLFIIYAILAYAHKRVNKISMRERKENKA